MLKADALVYKQFYSKAEKSQALVVNKQTLFNELVLRLISSAA